MKESSDLYGVCMTSTNYCTYIEFVVFTWSSSLFILGWNLSLNELSDGMMRRGGLLCRCVRVVVG
jgi:hypothetical protein